ncbi:Scr1 family TA system antitoxin-like transcriptional regulator [Streptomonospora nanhaiensis]|uniref:Scr1 family TA system antitoxin-like transcriptional regulator n=1 Tax=Streptomonospora nanhaiensis TaxID=1323731 RepID=UPI001C388C7C|nr:Scr1 family TA system antitoxin-like transcriptional regulator [Streptomonospora nanhaiensis]MBV2364412.1 helix-turn-helix transcriptional regulator [Streptomonospora nanhaiensis]MBX9388444.1 helix-turn-helix transcriptional regulator [Streptomonospora nanhaiensis]
MGELQRELRRLRNVRGLSQTQVARELGFVPSAVSNWESENPKQKRSGPKRETIERLDALYDARGALVKLWEAHARNGETPVWLRTDKQLSERASAIEIVTPTVVPGLLQCPSYARFALREGRPNDSMDVIDQLVAVRCRQLEQLSAGTRVSATFPELGILAAPEPTRREQAAHLLALIDTGRITVHLVPRDDVLAGVTSPFQIYRLHDGTRAATIDHTNGSILVNESPGITRLNELARSALGNAASRHESLRRLKEMTT